MPSVIIIGAGHAGVQVATSLRSEGFKGRIQLIAKEKDFPYQKPPLSKDFLKGKITTTNLAFRTPEFYQTKEIELHLGIDIQQIDVLKKEVISSKSDHFPFDQLVLATGAANRPLNIAGSTLNGIYSLRTLADTQIIQTKLAQSQKLVVIGGGFIGLEVAAAAIAMGKEVTLVEAQDRLMARVLPHFLSTIFQKEQEVQGVKFHFSSFTESYKGSNEQVTGVHLSDGSSIAADMVVVGIGVVPNTELAKTAGIDCENGIMVNEYMQTNHANIFAVGDVANHFNHFAKKRLRLESVQNAVDQAKTVASFITGKQIPYRAVPWFWTNQYHLKLQMAGFNIGFDDYVVRGNQTSGKFSIFYYKEGQLIGADSLNKAADHLGARKLLQAGISPNRMLLADTSIKLKSLL